MALEDRTTFEAISFQFQQTEAFVIAIMRSNLKRSSFNLWRKRVNTGTSQKHVINKVSGIGLFKCNRQQGTISLNKISKR
jgi:uncharacterized protein (TIGR03643 family)